MYQSSSVGAHSPTIFQALALVSFLLTATCAVAQDSGEMPDTKGILRQASTVLDTIETRLVAFIENYLTRHGL